MFFFPGHHKTGGSSPKQNPETQPRHKHVTTVMNLFNFF